MVSVEARIPVCSDGGLVSKGWNPTFFKFLHQMPSIQWVEGFFPGCEVVGK
jgi:hypothetical protein